MRAALDGRGGVGRRPRRDGTGSVGAGGAAPAAREPGPMRRGRVAPRVGQEPWGVRSWPCAHRWGEWVATSTIAGNAVLGPGAGPPRRRARKGDVSRAARLHRLAVLVDVRVQSRRVIGRGPDGRVGSGVGGGVDDRGRRCAAVGRVFLRWGGSAAASGKERRRQPCRLAARRAALVDVVRRVSEVGRVRTGWPGRVGSERRRRRSRATLCCGGAGLSAVGRVRRGVGTSGRRRPCRPAARRAVIVDVVHRVSEVDRVRTG